VPELPEVETVRQGLARWVVGRTISSVEVLHPRAVRRHVAGAADFAAVLAGRTITAVRRRGKYLWFSLSCHDHSCRDHSCRDHGTAPDAVSVDVVSIDAACADVTSADGTAGEDALLCHLGMSGQLLLLEASAPPGPHLRIRFAFADGGSQLRFVDQRTFGGLAFSPGGALLPAEIAHIARDPFDTAFDPEAVVAALRSRRTGLKRALLDQTLVSGVGNIYADESLWRARLHGGRLCASLSRPAARRLLGHVRDVLGEALHAGGTSFDSLYVNVNGESGYFSRSLAVYGREGEPCRRCGAPIRREPFMNRSSYSCPRCQPTPRPRARPRDTP
jgi:formamidopyrimidine-DNA glycosylase